MEFFPPVLEIKWFTVQLMCTYQNKIMGEHLHTPLVMPGLPNVAQVDGLQTEIQNERNLNTRKLSL